LVAEHGYNLLVIGSSPAGPRAVTQAAKPKERVAVVERKAILGGVCINTGTIPGKALREAVLLLSGDRDYGCRRGMGNVDQG
jgi:NAD(P) transhydrogenase